MILLEKPIFLLVLLLLMPCIYLCHFSKFRGGRILVSFKIYHEHHHFKNNRLWQFISGLSHLLFWLALSLLCLALANPGFVERHHILLKENSAIMIVMDVSPSMAAQDSSQNAPRFAIAKDAILRFVTQRNGNPVGLITFGLEAAVRIPLTSDYDFFKERMSDVALLEHGDGTNIGMALALAALQLQRSGAENKIIVLITDGANNVGEFNPADAISLLQSLEIQAFTVGVGSGERLRISVWDERTDETLSGFIDDAYDEDLMRAIALGTNGHFFKSESASAFDSMFMTLEQQQSQDGLSRMSVSTTSTQYQIASLALMLLLAWVFIRYLLLREVF
jgi:Ca-activated chloride channel homolog